LEGSDNHNLRILEMVYKIMEVPERVNDTWCNTYLECMEEAVYYEITNRGERLRPLAEVCYMKLKVIVDNSKIS